MMTKRTTCTRPPSAVTGRSNPEEHISFMKPFLFLLALGYSLVGVAVDLPADAVFADLAVAEKRVAAQQAIFDASRTFPNASPEAKAWFERIRAALKRMEDPEVQAALGQVLLLDPAYKRLLPLNPKPPQAYAAPEGTTPETKLAELERMLDLRRSPSEYPLTVDALVALAKSEDFATAQRANRLLRRISATAAAPLLWERLSKLTQRSQVQEVEDEILRLPASLAAKLLPVEPPSTNLAVKAAWARIVGVRVHNHGKSRLAIKATMLPLLKGSANELTEAAWAAVPKLFVEADRAALTEASVGLSERLAPKVKAALEALPAK